MTLQLRAPLVALQTQQQPRAIARCMYGEDETLAHLYTHTRLQI